MAVAYLKGFEQYSRIWTDVNTPCDAGDIRTKYFSNTDLENVAASRKNKVSE